MKRLAWAVAVLTVPAMLFGGCGATKLLHCDHCGKEVTVQESSNMEEEWIVYCAECNEELFGDDPLLSGK